MGRLRSLQADIYLELGRAAESGRAVHEIKHDGDRRARGGETAICDGTGLAVFNLVPFRGQRSHWLQGYLGAIGFRANIGHKALVGAPRVAWTPDALPALSICDHQKRSPEPRISIA
jgi:hypothetical protein